MLGVWLWHWPGKEFIFNNCKNTFALDYFFYSKTAELGVFKAVPDFRNQTGLKEDIILLGT